MLDEYMQALNSALRLDKGESNNLTVLSTIRLLVTAYNVGRSDVAADVLLIRQQESEKAKVETVDDAKSMD